MEKLAEYETVECSSTCYLPISMHAVRKKAYFMIAITFIPAQF